MLTQELTIEYLKSNNFIQSNYDVFCKTEIDNQFNGFKMDQIAPFQNNLENINKYLPKNNRGFYIVKLSDSFQIRAWGTIK